MRRSKFQSLTKDKIHFSQVELCVLDPEIPNLTGESHIFLNSLSGVRKNLRRKIAVILFRSFFTTHVHMLPHKDEICL